MFFNILLIPEKITKTFCYRFPPGTSQQESPKKIAMQELQGGKLDMDLKREEKES